MTVFRCETCGMEFESSQDGADHSRQTHHTMAIHDVPSGEVTFTQYLMPDGRQKPVKIDRPIETATKAYWLLAHGYKLDIEMLSTRDGRISMTCEPTTPDAHGDTVPIAHEIVENGPPVIAAVDSLIARAYTVAGGPA